jgi:hypothetical protein
MSNPDNGNNRLTSENGAHWVTAHAIPVRATSIVAPKVVVIKLGAETLSFFYDEPPQYGRTHNVLNMHRAKRAWLNAQSIGRLIWNLRAIRFNVPPSS